ncbi:MAG: DinB family protein [Ferruginibacter sp.]
MKETARITELFEDLYDGEAWIGETLSGTIKNVSAKQAAGKITPQWNSIWEILIHLIRWRENVLQRVQGVITESPDHNYFWRVEDESEEAWSNTLVELEKSQQNWISFLHGMHEEDLEKVYERNNLSYYKNIHGIIQHDAYHLGQVIMLAKHGAGN